jgi:alkyl sulfatase BDS1-like metallo-beta-lactamase superfamily hydrolase
VTGVERAGSGVAAELLEASSRYIDEGIFEGAASVSPIDGRVGDFGGGVALVLSFSHVIAVEGGGGLALVDTSSPSLAPRARTALRTWSDAPVRTIIYTHGHVDHVGGARLFSDEAADAGEARPRVVAHEAVDDRFSRYDLTHGYNALINARQFGRRAALGVGQGDWPTEWVRPDTTFSARMTLRLGGEVVELRHARGETDDHAWLWMPDRRIICGGDFLTWVFPNAGNPQKVQRYPGEWALALREMASLHPELFLPAHGLPISGAERVARVLDDIATALESLVTQTVALMNAGARLDDVVREVRVPAELADRPYLRATYDEPEFVVRNIWRLYGGWWDGDPAHLKPAGAAELAAELADLVGGAGRLASRATDLAAAGDLRLACHLAELATQAAPASAECQAARAEVYRARRDGEVSLMARGIFGAAAEASAPGSTGGPTGGPTDEPALPAGPKGEGD